MCLHFGVCITLFPVEGSYTDSSNGLSYVILWGFLQAGYVCVPITILCLCLDCFWKCPVVGLVSRHPCANPCKISPQIPQEINFVVNRTLTVSLNNELLFCNLFYDFH